MDAGVQCGDMNMALEYFKLKKVPNFVDVVSSKQGGVRVNSP